jgi:hypothetical protein
VYAQALGSKHLLKTTVHSWISNSVWTKVPGGLATDPTYKRNMQRASDPDDPLTLLAIFSTVGLNNNSKAAKRLAEQVLDSLLDFKNHPLNPLSKPMFIAVL